MKYYLVLGLILCLGNLKAAVLLVNNTPNSPGQYAQIDAAIAAASNGDTIYVSGSTIPYSNCTVTKGVAIIGPGAYNQTQFQFDASIASITIPGNIGNIKVKGMAITSGITANNLTGLHDVEIANCYLSGPINMVNCVNTYNIIIKNNIVSYSGNGLVFTNSNAANGNYNFVIENNLLRCAIFGLSLANALVQNNTFFGSSSSAFNGSCANFIINNNIFYQINPTANTSACIYTNNISYNSNTTYASMGPGNLDNTDPMFVNVPSTTVFDINYNYHLQSGSLAIAAGSDGTSLGIYGGNSNMSTAGETYGMPVIRIMNLQNFNVPQNGNVNVKVRSTKSRTN